MPLNDANKMTGVIGADEDFNEVAIFFLSFASLICCLGFRTNFLTVSALNVCRKHSTNLGQWARKVDDDTWNWKNVKQRFKKIESSHVEVPEEDRKYVNPKAEGKLRYNNIFERAS